MTVSENGKPYVSPGRFIVLEGLDGAGTTTQTARLVEWLRSCGIRGVATAEPTDGLIGKQLRAWLETQTTLPPSTAALLFAADRDLHLRDETEGILSLLARGQWVVSDRYLFSSLAYQSAEGVALDDLLEFNRLAPDPDLTVFLDIEPERALSRLESRGSPTSRYENAQALGAVWRAYNELRASGRGLGSLAIVDGRGPVEEVELSIRAAVSQQLDVTGSTQP